MTGIQDRVVARLRAEWPGMHIDRDGYPYTTPEVREGGATAALIDLAGKIAAEEAAGADAGPLNRDGRLGPQDDVQVCAPTRAEDEHLWPIVGRHGVVLSTSGVVGAPVYTCRVLVSGAVPSSGQTVCEIPSDMLTRDTE